MSNELNLEEKLKNLSPEERALAIEIFKQYAETGKSELLDELKYNDFSEIPVDIETFLDDPDYLGHDIWVRDEMSGEERCTLFPYWRKTLKEIFPDNLTTAYNTLILTGSIGLGKTEVASIAMLYLLYRMLCLKDPYTYYGLMPNDKITFSLLNITMETAKGVGWQKVQQHIQNSPWFMAHGSLNASRTAPTWQPDKNIELVFGSSNNQVVGRALFCNFSDEVNFSGGNSKNIENQKQKLLKLISQIDARMVSRFGKGTFKPTLNIIASSKDTEQSFLDSYINTKKKNESKTVMIIDEPQWVVRNDKGTPDDPGAFWVAIGGKFLAHELLPVGANDELVASYRAKGYEMLKIPPIYREDFETNLDQALMDDAGRSSASTTKFISGIRLGQAQSSSYKNPFVKDVIQVGNNPEDHLQYANFFDVRVLDPADYGKPLFIHLDMSMTGDKTGIAGTVIEGKYPSIPGQEESLSLRYKLLFSVSVEAPKGYQISFEKTQNFIKWLRERGFAIKMISADTFQSAAVLQELTTAGFKTQVLSVDRTDKDKICQPYQYLRSAIYEQRYKMYADRSDKKPDLLTFELTELEKTVTGKIDHPPKGSKDQADAVCGSLYMASKFAEEYSVNYGDNLHASLDVSMETSFDLKTRKEQLMVDFEKELAQVYLERDHALEVERRQKQAEYQSYIDIADGIIAI